MINTVIQVSHSSWPNTNLSFNFILSLPKFSLIVVSSISLHALVHLHPPRVCYVIHSVLTISKDLYAWLYINTGPYYVFTISQNFPVVMLL